MQQASFCTKSWRPLQLPMITVAVLRGSGEKRITGHSHIFDTYVDARRPIGFFQRQDLDFTHKGDKVVAGGRFRHGNHFRPASWDLAPLEFQRPQLKYFRERFRSIVGFSKMLVQMAADVLPLALFLEPWILRLALKKP